MKQLSPGLLVQRWRQRAYLERCAQSLEPLGKQLLLLLPPLLRLLWAEHGLCLIEALGALAVALLGSLYRPALRLLDRLLRFADRFADERADRAIVKESRALLLLRRPSRISTILPVLLLLAAVTESLAAQARRF